MDRVNVDVDYFSAFMIDPSVTVPLDPTFPKIVK